MYEERQKKWVFDQTLGNSWGSNPQKMFSTTATSNNQKAGGATSSMLTKPTSSATPPRDTVTGKWHVVKTKTFGGTGEPMDIGQMHAKGLCFRCHKHGHLSKDCPDKKDYRDIRSVQATNEPVTESKVEEDLHTVTSCLPMHSNIPALTLSAFNVSRMTSTPVLESQNRYATLSVEECDNNGTNTPLKGSNDGLPARAEAKAVNPAGHEAESLSTLRNRGANRCASSLRGETQPTKAFGENSPTIMTPIDTVSQPRRTDGAWDKLKYAPCEVSSQDEQAALTQRSPIAMTDIESLSDGVQENTARSPRSKNNVAGMTTFSSTFPQGIVLIALSDAPMPKVAGRTGNSAFAVRVQPIVSIAAVTELGDTLQVRQVPQPDQKEYDEDHQACPSKAVGVAKATTMKKIAAGKEAASAQAVERGHSVSIIEVPDEDDDTAYQIWLAKERTPAIAKKGNEPSSVPSTKSDTLRWFKPFEVNWTLHAVCEA
ncbi:uncharacterized protein ARMOST_14269 [Armillaria ostoyae]|uniref:CCHC-type domain-containing protein n=1 Tax=Armillaria ostoyae TaxID=47428 RepID=A0A284RQ50_ARMOS|nr:uncharacterized protein ARMOST_14269 [Armillaria ostoyae]